MLGKLQNWAIMKKNKNATDLYHLLTDFVGIWRFDEQEVPNQADNIQGFIEKAHVCLYYYRIDWREGKR